MRRECVETSDLLGAALDQEITGDIAVLDVLPEVAVETVIAADKGAPLVLGEGF